MSCGMSMLNQWNVPQGHVVLMWDCGIARLARAPLCEWDNKYVLHYV